MRNRADEIRKRIAKRRKFRQQTNQKEGRSFLVPDEEKYGGRPFYQYDQGESNNNNHPLIKKEWLAFQLMAAVALFLIVGIMFKNPSPNLDSSKAFVHQTFENEFKFATVANWYENQFGKPLALLPVQDLETQVVDQQTRKVINSEPVYAVPAAGRVLESFADTGEGVMVETGLGSQVEAIDEGYVVFAGNRSDTGKTVEIQHADGSTSYYGNLQTIDVNLYDFVEMRSKVGEVTTTEDGKSGMFYFAIKQGESFIDPKQVIPFD